MTAKPAKKGKGKGKEKSAPDSRGPKGFLTGIMTIQDGVRQHIAIYIDVILVGLDFLKEEADRIGERYQAVRGRA